MTNSKLDLGVGVGVCGFIGNACCVNLDWSFGWTIFVWQFWGPRPNNPILSQVSRSESLTDYYTDSKLASRLSNSLVSRARTDMHKPPFLCVFGVKWSEIEPQPV